jgi:cytoskeletal protein RodZ
MGENTMSQQNIIYVVVFLVLFIIIVSFILYRNVKKTINDETQRYVSFVMKNALDLDINQINNDYNSDTDTCTNDTNDDENTKSTPIVEKMEVITDNNQQNNQQTQQYNIDEFKDIDSYVDPLNS